MRELISGLFENSSKVSLAIYRLAKIGVLNSEISVVANHSYAKDDFAIDEGTKAAEGGILGAASVGILAAVVAGFTAVGTGGTDLLIAGPLVAALTAGGAGGTLGAIIGAFSPNMSLNIMKTLLITARVA